MNFPLKLEIHLKSYKFIQIHLTSQKSPIKSSHVKLSGTGRQEKPQTTREASDDKRSLRQKHENQRKNKNIKYKTHKSNKNTQKSDKKTYKSDKKHRTPINKYRHQINTQNSDKTNTQIQQQNTTIIHKT